VLPALGGAPAKPANAALAVLKMASALSTVNDTGVGFCEGLSPSDKTACFNSELKGQYQVLPAHRAINGLELSEKNSPFVPVSK
jgi:hypothetical protein